MITFAFCVRDNVVNAYMPPFFARSKGEAIRSFTDAVNDPNHQFSKHSADYSLYLLAQFDDVAGTVLGLPEPERIVGATEVLKVD